MVHPHFTFRRKISHTADSQDQRHRTIPGSRPVLAAHLSRTPDYIVPALIQITPQANEFYAATMEKLWANLFKLIDQGAGVDAALYLLPNAFPIRFEESGSLLDYHHKWVHRLCYTAQEEIWKTCLEEVRQVQNLFPQIGKHLYAPCSMRQTAGRKPFCPEGSRFCGVPVWKLNLSQYERIL
jgi:thymidylate synthase ThyX